MTKTGLLSLTIHDSLTFDGAELCLHPDLFAAPVGIGGGSSQQQRKSNLDDGNIGKSGSTAASTTSATTASIASTASPSRLSVGDTIEIRVWDPLPREQVMLRGQAAVSPASVFRRPPMRSSPLTASSTATSVHVEFPPPSTTTTTTTTTTNSTGMSGPPGVSTPAATNLRPRTDSLAYSEAERSFGENEVAVSNGTFGNQQKVDRQQAEGLGPQIPTSGQEGDSTTPWPNKTPTLPSSLPPVFPRSKANTIDTSTGGGAAATNIAASSSKVHPSQKSMSNQRRGQGNVPQSQFSPTFVRHTRQISDMTADTHQNDSGDMTLQRDGSIDEESTTVIDPIGGGNGPMTHLGENAWSTVNSTHRLRLSFVLLVTDKTLTCLNGKSRTQISMLRQVADLYSLSSYDMVTVHKIDPQDVEEVLRVVSADYVVVTIKDQFISRGDMLIFQRALQGTWIYQGQRLTEETRQIKAHAREIRHENYLAKSGIVTDKTMITFRSRSARIIWLVQLSSEMWDYASPYKRNGHSESVCETYFDQWIRFLYKLFEKWKALEVTHSLTVIFFSRTLLGNGEKSTLKCQDVYGRQYEDHYKPIIENETRANWDSLIVRIKEEFVKYPMEVGWNLTNRWPSQASQGNVLEAVNVTLNLMQYHYLDRDFHRTGNSVVVVSPGCGVFEVDKELAGITYQRMMDNGIGSDMLSLGLPPLHIAPFFLYNNNDNQNVDSTVADTIENYYEVPHWMHLSFIGYDREEHQVGEYINTNATSPIVKHDALDSFEVGAHGFLKPKGTASEGPAETGSPMFKPTAVPSTFSAIGNKAATPAKVKTKQERQLISGRDFRDILEASRPRMFTTKLPSALLYILKLQQSVVEERKRQELGKVTETPKEIPSNHESHVPPSEWGAVDFSEMPLRPPRSNFPRSDGPSSPKSPNQLIIDRVFDDSESGSRASSWASHVSSFLGISYDRVLWDHHDTPLKKKVTFQIQRSPSLEFDISNQKGDADTDFVAGEDYLSIDADDVSKGSDGHDVELHPPPNESLAPFFNHEKHASSLQKIMDAHDMKVWQLTTKANPAGLNDLTVIRPESIQHVESEVTIASAKHGTGVVGGLDAALTQYSSAFAKEVQPSTLLTRRASGGFLPGETRSRGRSPILPSIPQRQDLTARAMSPMLLPPLLPASGQNIGVPDVPLKPKQDRDANFARQRPQMFESSSLTRDGMASFGIFSGSNYEYGGYQNSMSSMSIGDSGRQLIRPIARSPPGSGLIRPIPKSQTIPSSPPGVGIPRERSTQRQGSKESRSSSPPPGSSGLSRQQPPRRGSPTNQGGGTQRSHKSSLRKQKVCNPFRQSDEDEVLAKRSHNRRRWSHVFPVGEAEFKRHSGPIWNSLTAPAILPLSVDYFPSPQELATFQFNPYTVTLGGIENKHYSTHAELLFEMVRQRVTQDYQIVTEVAVKESENRPEPQRIGIAATKGRPNNRRESFVPSLPTIKHDNSGNIRHYLSMGHRIQVLNYDPNSDTIEIVHYHRKSAQNDPSNVYTYRFMMYSRGGEGYTQSVQTFKKYAEPYKWNKVDNLICGEEERQLEVGMRFRQVMFGLIPEKFINDDAEQEYISKFQRLLEYLSKLRETTLAESTLEVSIVSSKNPREGPNDIFQVRQATEDSMKKFTVQLRKGKRDPFEWMEMAIDSTFDTSRAYRIMFNWLVASAAKVEAQVQLLHRRCTQFGLHLISFPQSTVSRDLFLHAFAVPTLLVLRNKAQADTLDDELKKMDFVDDGIRFTNGRVLECIESGEQFDFPKFRNGKVKAIPSLQYVHRSGTLFIRHLRDRQGWSILAGFINSRHANLDNGLQNMAIDRLRKVRKMVSDLASKCE